MTIRNYYCVNRYNVETDQWEYVPRYVRVDHGEIMVTKIERSTANDNDDESDN